MIHIAQPSPASTATVRHRAICGTPMTEVCDYDSTLRFIEDPERPGTVNLCIECAEIAAEAVAQIARVRQLQDVGAIRADALRIAPSPNGLFR